jgi:rare lipoprotein A
VAGALLLALASACTTSPGPQIVPAPPQPERDGPPPQPIDLASIADAVPRAEPRSRYGNPPNYAQDGQVYHVMVSSSGYVARGVASWYGTKFHGRRTSSGEPYDMYAMTAAHTTLPLPTYVQVTNLQNGRTAVVKVNDRGPFVKNRLIDLSYAAAARLGILEHGTGLVEVRALDPDTANSAAPPAPHGASLYLQVGAFTDPQNAERLQARLKETALAGVQVTAGHNSVHLPVYRVRIGPIVSIEEADRMADRLAELGIRDPHIVVD